MTKKNFKVLILTCWALLLICLVIKLFGGNWFELNSENTKFIQFCEFIEGNMVSKMILYCLIAITTTYPIICIMLNKPYLNIKHSLIFIPLIAVKSLSSWYITWLPYILDALCLIIIPLSLTKFKYWKRIILSNILIVVFQLIATIIRSVGLDLAKWSEVLDVLLMQIDYFIMVCLYYLYNFYFNKKELK